MQQTTSEKIKHGSAFWAADMKEAADEEPPKILWNKDEYYRLADLGFLTANEWNSSRAKFLSNMNIASLIKENTK